MGGVAGSRWVGQQDRGWMEEQDRGWVEQQDRDEWGSRTGDGQHGRDGLDGGVQMGGRRATFHVM